MYVENVAVAASRAMIDQRGPCSDDLYKDNRDFCIDGLSSIAFINCFNDPRHSLWDSLYSNCLT